MARTNYSYEKRQKEIAKKKKKEEKRLRKINKNAPELNDENGEEISQDGVEPAVTEPAAE